MPKILVADDEPAIQNVLARLFRGKGYDVQVASDGAEALRGIEEHEPDLLILDFRMPKLDGVQVLESLPPNVRRPLVLMLTAHADVELVRQTVRLGVYDYILKPFDLDYVERNVEEALRAAHRA